VSRKRFALTLISVAFATGLITWWVTLRGSGQQVVLAAKELSAARTAFEADPPSPANGESLVIASANEVLSTSAPASMLKTLSPAAIYELFPEDAFARATDGKELFDVSDRWELGERRDCVRYSVQDACSGAAAAQLTEKQLNALTAQQRLHRQTLAAFASSFCMPSSEIARRVKLDTDARQPIMPRSNDPRNRLIDEALNSPFLTDVSAPSSGDAIKVLTKRVLAYRSCTGEVGDEYFINLEAQKYRKHLSAIASIESYTSNEIIQITRLASELVACRLGNACLPMGITTILSCQKTGDCNPAQSFIDRRRDRTAPRIFNAAQQLADFYWAYQAADRVGQ
jgi:hypothetical protein